MQLLLDTHALLWWFTDDAALGSAVRALIADEDNDVYVSAASAWEIATKHRLGKLQKAAGAVTRFDELVAADGFQHLAIDYRHALRAGGYPQAHRDPFDRVLAAQAELNALNLVTVDPVFVGFPVTVCWPGDPS